MSDLIKAIKEEIVNNKGLKIENADWHTCACELFELRMVIKELEAKERLLREKLIELSEGMSRHNDIFMFQRIQSRGRLDYPQIIKDYMVTVETYRKEPIVSWELNKV